MELFFCFRRSEDVVPHRDRHRTVLKTSVALAKVRPYEVFAGIVYGISVTVQYLHSYDEKIHEKKQG